MFYAFSSGNVTEAESLVGKNVWVAVGQDSPILSRGLACGESPSRAMEQCVKVCRRKRIALEASFTVFSTNARSIIEWAEVVPQHGRAA